MANCVKPCDFKVNQEYVEALLEINCAETTYYYDSSVTPEEAQVIEDAISHVSNSTGIVFNRIAGRRANVTIGFAPLDGPLGVLGAAWIPSNPDTIRRVGGPVGRIIFDSNQQVGWSEEDLYNLAIHEIMHCAGVDHMGTGIMSPGYDYRTDFRMKLTIEEINAARNTFRCEEVVPEPIPAPEPAPTPEDPVTDCCLNQDNNGDADKEGGLCSMTACLCIPFLLLSFLGGTLLSSFLCDDGEDVENPLMLENQQVIIDAISGIKFPEQDNSDVLSKIEELRSFFVMLQEKRGKPSKVVAVSWKLVGDRYEVNLTYNGKEATIGCLNKEEFERLGLGE